MTRARPFGFSFLESLLERCPRALDGCESCANGVAARRVRVWVAKCPTWRIFLLAVLLRALLIGAAALQDWVSRVKYCE